MTIEQVRPDFLEVHDPWFSTPFGLLLRHQRAFRGLLACFCHSDPVTTYIEPRLASWLGPGRLLTGLVGRAHRGFAHLQDQFDVTFVASDIMRDRMRRNGVRRVVKVGFGVDRALLNIRRSPERGVTRLLYAGRLDDDKEFGLVLGVLPDLLHRTDVVVTIIGAGAHEKRVAMLSHPRLRYLGFLRDPAAVRAAYAGSDVLLAPGRYETFGLVALEAAAAGLMVVGPDQGGTGEILRQLQSPLLFPAGDRQTFLDRIVMILEGSVGNLVERSRDLAARYGTWNESVGRHVATCESMLGGHAEARRLLA
jgi:glycosyltransferase involved in cell wall biosynthesis